MKDIIKLQSKDGESSYLRRLIKPDGSKSNTYSLKTSSYIKRSGQVEQKRFIVISEGPTITEGDYLEEAKAVVKSIEHITGMHYAITLEDKLEEELV